MQNLFGTDKKSGVREVGGGGVQRKEERDWKMVYLARAGEEGR